MGARRRGGACSLAAAAPLPLFREGVACSSSYVSTLDRVRQRGAGVHLTAPWTHGVMSAPNRLEDCPHDCPDGVSSGCCCCFAVRVAAAS